MKDPEKFGIGGKSTERAEWRSIFSIGSSALAGTSHFEKTEQPTAGKQAACTTDMKMIIHFSYPGLRRRGSPVAQTTRKIGKFVLIIGDRR